MILFCDTRQQKGKHKLKEEYFESQGIEIIRTKLPYGDYSTPQNPNIAIDTKKDIQELIIDVTKDHERFKWELQLAKKCGAKLIILVEDENFKLYDLVKYNGYEWYIIKIDNENVTLLMKNKLDNDTMKSLFDEEYLDADYDAKFNLDASNNDWTDSIIRQVLNEKFINKFNKNELNIMKTNYDEDKCSDDYIRLLTIREVEKLPKEIRSIDEYYWTLSPSRFASNYSDARVWLVLSS